MSLNLTGARAAMVTYAMPDLAEISTPGAPVSDGRGGTIPGAPSTVSTVCSVAPVSGAEAAEPMVTTRGNYRIDLPWATTIAEGATIAALGRRFRVIWAPPAGGLDLARTVGATEIR